MNQQKLLSVHALPHYAQYMKVAHWFKGRYYFVVQKAGIKPIKVRKRAKIRNRYNQAPHPTQDTNGKVTTSVQDITNESQEVSLFPAGDHTASTNRRACNHDKTRQK